MRKRDRYTLASGRRLDGLYVEAGRRAHITGRIDGSYGGFREVSKQIVNPPGGGTEGVWVEPLLLLDYVHFFIKDEPNGLASVERNCVEYSREVGFSRFDHRFYSHPYLHAEKRIWVPRLREAVVIDLTLENESDRDRQLTVIVEARSDLKLGWPRRDSGHDSHSYDPELGAVVARDDLHPDWVAIWGTDHDPQAHHQGPVLGGMVANGAARGSGHPQVTDDRATSHLEYLIGVPSTGTVGLRLVLTGGYRGIDQAVGEYRAVRKDADRLLSERIDHYGAILDRRPVIQTPSYPLNKAFEWAKLGSEDFKHEDPDLGLCYFAGYPAYNFFFASDTFRILYGAICAGDFEDTKEVLRMILRYQAEEPGPDTLPGEIWHEMSTTGDVISPNFCTLDFPPLLEQVYLWTGDRAFLEELYPNLAAAVEWGYRMDIDGDGLLENGPEGEMADSAFEDTNMEGSHLAPNLAWLRALQSGVRIAKLVDDNGSAARWENTVNELGPRLNCLYWKEAAKEFEETIRPDGSTDSSWRGITIFDPAVVDEGKARYGLRKLCLEEQRLTHPEAFARWAEEERDFSTWREHLSWYLVARGDRARHLIQNHETDLGLKALEEIAAVPFTVGTPGHFPEVIGMHDPVTAYVKGCAHQAWSSACGILHPVVAGLFGIAPDAASHSVTIDPHWPDDWGAMLLERLRVGEHQLHVRYERGRDGVKATIGNDSRHPLAARIGFVVPQKSEIAKAALHDSVEGSAELELKDPRLSIRHTADGAHAYVETNVPPGGSSAVELHFRPAPWELEVDEYLNRTQPGSGFEVLVGITNQSIRRRSAVVRLELPSTWVQDERPHPKPVELDPGERADLVFDMRVPPDASERYYTLRALCESSDGDPIARPVYLPVFGALELRLDGRGIARVRLPYTLRVAVSNLTQVEVDVEVSLEGPQAMFLANPTRRLVLEVDETAVVEYSLLIDSPGEFQLRPRATAAGGEFEAAHALQVLPTERSIVVYSGFLGCPIATDEDLEVLNMPANYAVRKPHVMDELLPLADVFLTSDQHDAEFSPPQVREMLEYVGNGGRLLMFCFWSSPWGRGFHDTYGGLAGTELADALPLVMKRGIGRSEGVHLEGRGREVLGKIDWGQCPPYDFNRAELHPEAELWARSQDSDPLIASRSYGKGRLMAIAIDCFGFGTQGIVLRWPGIPEMIRRSVLDLLNHSRPGE